MDFLTRFLKIIFIVRGRLRNRVLYNSLLVPVFKNKGFVQRCSKWGIKLMRHAIKMCERVVEAGLKREAAISEQLYGV